MTNDLDLKLVDIRRSFQVGEVTIKVLRGIDMEIRRNELADKFPAQMSGGEQQRVEVVITPTARNSNGCARRACRSDWASGSTCGSSPTSAMTW